MADEPQKTNDFAIVEKALDRLGDHFDTVQILCTRHEPGELNGTVTVEMGVGNWFARYGQIREWVNKAEERCRMSLHDPKD